MNARDIPDFIDDEGNEDHIALLMNDLNDRL